MDLICVHRYKTITFIWGGVCMCGQQLSFPDLAKKDFLVGKWWKFIFSSRNQEKTTFLLKYNGKMLNFKIQGWSSIPLPTFRRPCMQLLHFFWVALSFVERLTWRELLTWTEYLSYLSQNIKIYRLISLKFGHVAKLQSLQKCRWPETNQKHLPKQKDLSNTEQRLVSRTAIKVNTTDTRLDLFITSGTTTHIGCRPAAALTGTANNQVPSIKSGTQIVERNRGVTRGVRGTQYSRLRSNIGAPNHCGWRHNVTSKYFLQCSTFSAKRPQIRTRGGKNLPLGPGAI